MGVRLQSKGTCVASIIVAMVTVPAATAAQSSDSTPVVVVRGVGRVVLDPNYAELGLGVQVQAASADAAATEMSARLGTMADTLTDLGLPPDSFPRTSFAVSPRYDFDDAQQLVGFNAGVIVTIRTSDLTRLPEYIGAALAAGATSVGSVRFLSTASEAARLDALEQAFGQARAEATRLASAAGATLGRPIEVTSQPAQERFYAAYLELEAANINSIAAQPQDVVVEASVTVRWELILP